MCPAAVVIETNSCLHVAGVDWKTVLSKRRHNSCGDWFPIQAVSVWRGIDRGVEAYAVEVGWIVTNCALHLLWLSDQSLAICYHSFDIEAAIAQTFIS